MNELIFLRKFEKRLLLIPTFNYDFEEKIDIAK